MTERESMIIPGATGSENTNVSIAGHYVFATPLYKKIKELGMTVTGFRRKGSMISFTYNATGRRPFDYAELLLLQEIINPEDNTEYPIPWGHYGEYTLYIQLPALAK